MENRKHTKQKSNSQTLYIVMAAAFVLITLTFAVYTAINDRQIQENNHAYLVNDTRQSADHLAHIIREGYSNIRILSELVSGSLTSAEVDVANYQRLIKDSLFDFVEYADQEGLDHNITGGTSDAHDRKYYQDAMNGNCGMEVIYNSRATHENLLMFYAPLYYRGEIIGSLIGVYQASNRIKEILSQDYFGVQAPSYLCTAEGKVFVGSGMPENSTEQNIFDSIEVNKENCALLRSGLASGEDTSFSAREAEPADISQGYPVPTGCWYSCILRP